MDTNKIKTIISIFEESTIASMDLEIDDIKIKLKKAQEQAVVQGVMPQASAPAPIVAPVPVQEAVEEVKDYVTSPLVGTFYSAPSADSANFVEVGSNVKKGDVVCIIEAMKVMNEIRAHRDGVVVEIKANNNDMVQFEQPLIAIGD